ncbi:hypothetical protein GCM10009105_08070 [Dokdonella soli]|uniref:HTH araC/xylS-type domain-containing protein n=1 Tax=Dokdonella soli TaxID=529810 RepID=A0ABN1IE77_9GAMM
MQLGRFVRELKDRDRIFGIKFHPGAFYPFLRTSVSSIANTTIPATQVFANATEAEREVLACDDDQGMVETAARFLAAHRPPLDPQADSVRRVVEDIVNDRSITRVEHLVARFEIQERTLQRLFDRYVGASPRWVIKRYRVHEALEQITAGLPTDWATLAQDLGYFDQAHFINDFRKLVGCSPAEYARV